MSHEHVCRGVAVHVFMYAHVRLVGFEIQTFKNHNNVVSSDTNTLSDVDHGGNPLGQGTPMNKPILFTTIQHTMIQLFYNCGQPTRSTCIMNIIL